MTSKQLRLYRKTLQSAFQCRVKHDKAQQKTAIDHEGDKANGIINIVIQNVKKELILQEDKTLTECFKFFVEEHMQGSLWTCVQNACALHAKRISA